MSIETKITDKEVGNLFENETLIDIIGDIENLIGLTQDQVVELNKDERVVVSATVKLPRKISYALIKTLGQLKPIRKLQRSVIDEVSKIIKKEYPIDQTRYSKDEVYAKEMDALYKSKIISHELYEEFKKDTKAISFHTIDLTETNRKEIDPDDVFDPVYTPVSLIDTIFIFE